MGAAAAALGGLRCRAGRATVLARLAARLLLNVARARLGPGDRRPAGGRHCGRRVPEEPPQIRRLQAMAGLWAPPPPPPAAATARDAAAGRAELLAEVLACCAVPDVGRCAAASWDFQRGALEDGLWCRLCTRRWEDRQHSVHMRRWLAHVRARPEAEELLLDYASDEQLRLCQEAGLQHLGEAPRRCRVASWRDRYVFAERDAQRKAISAEELCWDAALAGRALHDLAGEPEESSSGQSPAAKKQRRRWAMTLHFSDSFDLEGFFHSDGRFFDTGKFRHESVPWHFVHSAKGEVMVQIVPGGQHEIGPLRVERCADWGWRLISTGAFADLVHFNSRQLTLTEHVAAAQTPPEIVTMYLRRCPGRSGGSGPCGVWRCFRMYQGTMLAPSWVDRTIHLERDSLTILLPSRSQTYKCTVNELQSTIDFIADDDSGNDNVEQRTERCVYQLEAGGQVLVVTRNELRGGLRPAGPPEGLPPMMDILDAEMKLMRP